MSTSDRIAAIYETEARAALATLVRLLGDLDLAEESLADAWEAALETWPRRGVPDNPRAWLVSTGRFKGIDRLRRSARGRRLAAALDQPSSYRPAWDSDAIKDDQLRLVFTCCHPEIRVEARIALALKVVCGLSTDEIARAFLVTPSAMKRRISRAKATIIANEIPYEVPGRHELAERLDAVLRVVYLVYNEAYSATSGDSHLRRDLARQAVVLSRLLVELMPVPETLGLLALLLLHESRSLARTDDAGDIVPLEEQDRSRWDAELIAEGLNVLGRAAVSGRVGQYTLQAAIASVHAQAASVEETRWDVIVGYYDMLVALQPSPVVALHRAIAVAMRDGPNVGLALVDELIVGPMSDYHLAHAARADLARRAGRFAEAAASCRRALSLVKQEPERRFLSKRLGELEKKL